MKKYDYLIVGAGLFGAVFAHEARKAGRKCLVIDRRDSTGGNIRCESIEGINVHKYGAHIFHTDKKEVWKYVTRLVEMNRFTNSPVANFNGRLYNLPFNMNTFYQLWGTRTPGEAEEMLKKQRAEYASIECPANFEEQALKLCGRDIYETLIKGYTEKQWGRPARELPALLEGTETILQLDFFSRRDELCSLADKIVFTGRIDKYFDYRAGRLEYRSLRFDTKVIDTPNFQGNAVVNYTSADVPYTRIIEHKHFEYGTQPKTVITYEYPATWSEGLEPYYPVNNERNNAIAAEYRQMARSMGNVIFGGRLGQYAYFDMDDTVDEALKLAEKEMGN